MSKIEIVRRIPGLTNVVGPIGEGGFGAVFLADETSLDRRVAVKILEARDPVSLKQFDDERRALGRLSQRRSNNIVTVYRAELSPDGYPYIMMEYASGGSLADELEANGPLEWWEAFAVGIDVCTALSAAHAAEIQHRDVKPGNLFRSDDDSVLLGDFGIALLAAPSAQDADVLGSIPHVSPERAGGRATDARSDVYSLASTMHELMSGAPPFVRDDDPSLEVALYRLGFEDPPDIDGVPPHALAVVHRAMAKEPDERPRTAAAFGNELRRALEREDRPTGGGRRRSGPARGGRAEPTAVVSGPAPPVRDERVDTAQRSRRLPLAAAGIVAAAAAIGAVLLSGGDPAAPDTAGSDADRTTAAETVPFDPDQAAEIAADLWIRELGPTFLEVLCDIDYRATDPIEGAEPCGITEHSDSQLVELTECQRFPTALGELAAQTQRMPSSHDDGRLRRSLDRFAELVTGFVGSCRDDSVPTEIDATASLRVFWLTYLYDRDVGASVCAVVASAADLQDVQGFSAGYGCAPADQRRHLCIRAEQVLAAGGEELEPLLRSDEATAECLDA